MPGLQCSLRWSHLLHHKAGTAEASTAKASTAASRPCCGRRRCAKCNAQRFHQHRGQVQLVDLPWLMSLFCRWFFRIKEPKVMEGTEGTCPNSSLVGGFKLLRRELDIVGRGETMAQLENIGHFQAPPCAGQVTYPLVMTYIAVEHYHDGKIHFFYGHFQ